MIVRILIWSLFDSKTTIDELRAALPALPPPSAWIWSDAGERFGAVLHGNGAEEAVAQARALIGRDPEVYEEFDELEL